MMLLPKGDRARMSSASALGWSASDRTVQQTRAFAPARDARRCGKSLLELLVVIAIIGILFGLVLSAVQHVRAAAARSSCQNKMRQLGLALQMYHGSHYQFPPGVTGDDGANSLAYLSWNARLLPYLDQSLLWAEILRAYSADRDFLRVPPHVQRSTLVAAFTCPADFRAASPSHWGPAFTSYLGVEGSDQFSANGILYLDSRTRIADILDGSSHTLIVGERPGSADERFGWWYAGWGQNRDGSAEMVLGMREYNFGTSNPGCPRGPYHFTPGRFDNQCDMFHFWSPHSGGANFGFADGSVRFITYSADAIMPALSTRAGGESVILPE
jgi:prepilin-type processing-associated H-X9-DG protein